LFRGGRRLDVIGAQPGAGELAAAKLEEIKLAAFGGGVGGFDAAADLEQALGDEGAGGGAGDVFVDDDLGGQIRGGKFRVLEADEEEGGLGADHGLWLEADQEADGAEE